MYIVYKCLCKWQQESNLKLYRNSLSYNSHNIYAYMGQVTIINIEMCQ